MLSELEIAKLRGLKHSSWEFAGYTVCNEDSGFSLLDRLLDEVERLRAFAQHQDWCTHREYVERACDCGLTDLQATTLKSR